MGGEILQQPIFELHDLIGGSATVSTADPKGVSLDPPPKHSKNLFL